MKKLFFVLATIMCFSVVSANAQSKGDMAAGVNFNYGFAYDADDFNNMAVGFKFQYNVADPIRLEVAANKFFEKDYLSMWDVMLNGHYLFPVGNLTIYPAVGLGAVGLKADILGYESKTSDFGFNLGAGVELPLTQNINLGAEIKYLSSDDLERMTLQLGATYRF